MQLAALAGAALMALTTGITPHLNMPDVPKRNYKEMKEIRLVIIGADTLPFKTSDLNSLVDTMVGSSWMKAIADSYGFHIPKVVKLTAVYPASFISREALIKFIHDTAKGKVPPGTDDSENIYVVFTPGASATAVAPNNTAQDPFHSGILEQGAANHDKFFSSKDQFALIVTSSTNTLADRSQPISHETIEAITDCGGGFDFKSSLTTPWDFTPFAFVQGKPGAEVCDVAANTHHLETGPGKAEFEFVRPVAAKAKGDGDPYIPAQPAGEIFYNTTVPANWTVMSGEDNASITIPLTGWSTAKADDWSFKITTAACGNGVSPADWSLAAEGGTNTINDGKTVNLTLRAAAKPVGDGWCVYKVTSTTPQKINDDADQFWMFGVRQMKPPTTSCKKGEVWCECEGKPGWCTTINACQHVCGGNIPGH